MASPDIDEISPIDNLIGLRIRLARKALKMTQSDLADKLNLSFQQVQKYESGQNKIYASRLLQISQILNYPIASFFEVSDGQASPNAGMSDNSQDGFDHGAALSPINNEYTVRIMRRLDKVPADKKRGFVEMVERMADMSR